MKATEHKINRFKVSNSVCIDRFTGCNHSLPLVPDILITSKETLDPRAGNHRGVPSRISWARSALCLWICLFRVFHTDGMEMRIFSPFVLGVFHLAWYFPGSSMLWPVSSSSVSFYTWVIFTPPILFIRLSVDAHLGCFCLLSTVNDAAINLSVHKLVWVPLFSSFGLSPKKRGAGSYWWLCV